jgi:hypothetical protein
VDTAITFSYLSAKGTEKDFVRFKEYGEGQKKLLMLHLQDSYDGRKTLEGREAADLADDIGGFAAETLQIELGNWAKKDTRRLAIEVGLEDYYRLVYSPTSADVHGTWASLRDSNLCICAEPLHRFHQLPSYSEPPLYVNTLVAAHNLLKKMHERAVIDLNFPTELELSNIARFLSVGSNVSTPASSNASADLTETAANSAS